MNREAEDRRRGDDDLREALRSSEANAATNHLRTEQALAEQKCDLEARLAAVAQQSGAALEAAQRALQTQQEAFSQVTTERDALAAAVGALRRQVEELQARAKRPWWRLGR